MKGVSCQNTSPNPTCLAVGVNGASVISTNGGSTWSAQSTGTSNHLYGITCPSGGSPSSLSCLAVGANGTILATSNSGASWTPKTSGTSQDLYAVTCDASYTNNCFASGVVATVLATTNAGNTWTQQGDPISGAAPNLSAGARTSNGIYEPAWSVTCTSSACLAGAGRYGSLMRTPLTTVSVTGSGVYGSTPGISGVSPTDPSVTVNPPSEGGEYFRHADL